MHFFIRLFSLPLCEVNQGYEYMRRDLKLDLQPSFGRRESKYQLVDWDIGTFEASCGYHYRFTALDTHMACTAMLDTIMYSKRDPIEIFRAATNCLIKYKTN